MDNEMMDIVNLSDEVTGTASREYIYKNKLPHRIVHVMIRDGDRILLQLRSAQARYLPLHWSTSAGWHVQSGESYEEAAQRETIEETGLTGKLTLLGKYFYTTEDGLQKFLSVYEMETQDVHQANPDEVHQLTYFTMSDIATLISTDEHIHPELLDIWHRFYSTSVS